MYKPVYYVWRFFDRFVRRYVFIVDCTLVYRSGTKNRRYIAYNR